MEASQSTPLSPCLEDLPRDLLPSILKQLPLEIKIKAEASCKMFRGILRDPSEGSSVWETVCLDDPVFEAASPAALAGWLRQRAPGIRLLQYKPPQVQPEAGPEAQALDLQRKQEMVRDVLQGAAAHLPPEAAIELDLSSARAESWFGSQELALPEPHGDYPLMPYCPWASLAGNLTHLELGFHQPVTGASILPLSQLTRLKSLSLQTNGWSADVDLSLPQLQKLQIINAAQHADITLNCLQLKTLVVESATPLEAFEGIPPGIEDISFSCLEDGSLSLHEMLWERELDQLKSLRVFMSPEFQSYDSPEASRVIKQVLRKGRLTTLVTDCPVEQLTPSAGAQCALLMSLQILELHLPLDKGIPEVLEQLTNLRSLTLVGPKWEPMHLTRSLDPFLNMKDLGCLAFMGKPIANDHALQIHFEWTPDAMEVILLARMRLQGSRRSQMLCC